jgi:hypothetical protein
MNVNSVALGGLQQAQKQVESIGGKLAQLPLAAAASGQDSVELSSVMVGLLAAQHVCARLVGVLPTGRKPPADLPAGGMDSQAYPEMLLAAVARTGGERAEAAPARTARAHAEGGGKQPGSLASGRDRQPANRAFERQTSPSWLSDAIGSGGLFKRLLQPPDAENRMSGGVGGATGAIP